MFLHTVPLHACSTALCSAYRVLRSFSCNLACITGSMWVAVMRNGTHGLVIDPYNMHVD